ncbi:MAG: hypothetical protein V4632_10760 [Pseudomonadota bacterium]
MASTFGGLFVLDAERPASNRLGSLKFRTLLTALTALACGYVGARMVVAPLSALGTWVYGQVVQQGALPPVHVPVVFESELGNWLLQAAFLFVSALAIIGFSAGVFGRARARVVMIPPLLLGVATMFFIPATSQWMQVFPSRLERDIMHGRFDAADRALNEAGAHLAVKQYVQAQIALRANDEQALKNAGEPVLKLADQWAYGAPGIERGALKSAAQLNPEVIHALDLALNREPQTQVGIQWEKESASRSTLGMWLAIMVRLGMGLAMLAAAIGLALLWNRMRRRVHIIQAGIEPAQTPEWFSIPLTEAGHAHADAAGVDVQAFNPVSDDQMARAEAMTGHLDLSLAPVIPRRRESPLSVTPEWQPEIPAEPVSDQSAWPRHARDAVIVAVVAGAAYLMLKPHIAGLTDADIVDADTYPCNYVGEWTSARAQSVYKVTLRDTGDFVAEPIARGAYSSQTIRGTWAVRGDKMEWRYEPGLTLQAPDINPIRNVTARSFTLLEVDGGITQFNLIEPIKSARCRP